MAAKKEIPHPIRQFKDGSNNYWCCLKHMRLNENKEIEVIAGGVYIEEEVEMLRTYLKRKKLL